MSLTKEITRLPKSAVRLSVTIPRDELGASYTKMVDKIAASVQIPGFRKGKAPRSVLESKFGDALKDDALQDIVAEAVDTILKADDFPQDDLPLSYSNPNFDGEPPKLDLEKDLVFNVKWDAAPIVGDFEWKGFCAEIPDVKVSEEDVKNELSVIQDRNAVVLDRAESEAAKEGDIVTVDYAELDDKDNAVPNTARSDFVCTLGRRANLYEFDEEIVGMKTGEEKVFTKTYPADFSNAEIAGSTKKLKVTVKAVKEKKLPDLDDDFAQDVDEKYKTLADLKADIKKKLSANLERALKGQKIEAIFDKIIENHPIELPESMIRYDIASRMSGMARQMGLDTNFLGRMMQNEPIIEEQRPRSEKSLKTILLEEKLFETLKIEVLDEDREAEYKKIAEESGETAEVVKEHYAAPAEKANLDNYIKAQKVHDILLKENTVKTGAKQSYGQFMGGRY